MTATAPSELLSYIALNYGGKRYSCGCRPLPSPGVTAYPERGLALRRPCRRNSAVSLRSFKLRSVLACCEGEVVDLLGEGDQGGDGGERGELLDRGWCGFAVGF